MSRSKYIQYEDSDGKRQTLSLPGFNSNQVKMIRRHVRAMNAARIGNLSIEQETSRWVSGINGWLRKKLFEAGLIDTRDVKPHERLAEFLHDYMANRVALVKSGNLESSTTDIDVLTVDFLVEFFGADKPLRDITEGDAFDFFDWLLAEGGRPVKRCGSEIVIRERKPLAESTVRKRCSAASKFFSQARRKRLIDENPFDKVDKGNLAATDNRYVHAKDAERISSLLPDPQWQLLFALAR